jgi:uncharacterized protein involved in exopolysaccharide biosynthesis
LTPAERQISEQDPIDSRELIALLWRRRLVIVGSAVLWTAALTAVAFLSTSVYRGTAVLLPANADRGVLGDLGSGLGSVSGLASLAGINLPSGNSNVDEALAVLRSRQFTEDFITANNLMPELYPKRGEPDSGTGNTNTLLKKPPTLARAFRKFDDDIRTVTRNIKTGLITVAIDWKDRTKAAAWANGMVRSLNAEMRARAIAKADASLGYLQKELAATTDVGTRDAVNRLIENEIKQRMFADVTEEYALRFVDQAMVPDSDDPVRPRKALLIAIGFILGTVVGVVVILLRLVFRSSARPSP